MEADERPVPGLLVVTGAATDALRSGSALFGEYAPVFSTPLTWLSVAVITRGASEPAVYKSSQGVSVFFEGYLTDVVGRCGDAVGPGDPARLLARLYLDEGLAFIGQLRGSYTFLIADKRNNQACLVNDRCASRPVFVRHMGKNSLVISPQLRLAARFPPASYSLNQAGVGSFLVHGCYYGLDTLFEGIQRFPQAGIMQLSPTAHTIDRYWQLKYQPPVTPIPEPELVDECMTLIRQATRRLLRVSEKPVLSLSGGIDSRIVLSFLLDAGVTDIPLVTYRYSGSTGDETDVAEEVAASCGLPIRTLSLAMEDYIQDMSRALYHVDGRQDVLDAPMVLLLWDALGEEFGTFYNGDQCFGWQAAVATREEARLAVRRHRLDEVDRLADWLRPRARRSIRDAMNVTIDRFMDVADEDDPNNLKDALFYQESMGNTLNAHIAGKLAAIEQARPLLDEDVMEFVSRLPVEHRLEKHLLQAVMARDPELGAIRNASKHGLPVLHTLLDKIRNEPELYRYFMHNFTTALDPRLEELFDIQRLLVTFRALAEGRELPPMRRSVLERTLMRLGLQRPLRNLAFPVNGMRRLLGLNLYLKSLAE